MRCLPSHWALVQSRRRANGARTSLIVQPLGTTREASVLNPDLDIWTPMKYDHVLMPDGLVKLGGEAVAEVLRRLPNTKWFAWSFATAYSIPPCQVYSTWPTRSFRCATAVRAVRVCGKPRVSEIRFSGDQMAIEPIRRKIFSSDATFQFAFGHETSTSGGLAEPLPQSSHP